MKILQIVHFYPPYSVGGCEIYTRNVARELSRTHSVGVLFTMPSSFSESVIQDGDIVCTAIQKDYATFGNPFHERDPHVEAVFEALVDRMHPDIVHVQHLMNLSLRLPFIARAKGIPVCYTLHDFWLICPRAFLLTAQLTPCRTGPSFQCCACMKADMRLYDCMRTPSSLSSMVKKPAKILMNVLERLRFIVALCLWRPYYSRLIMHNVDRFIAPSLFLHNYFSRYAAIKGKIVHVSHGIPCRPISKKKYFDDIPKFLYIGSLHAHKGVEVLIDAFNMVDKPCMMHIYGTAPPETVERLRTRCKNRNVHFMGNLSEAEKDSVFAEHDALIVPSLCYENLPLVILEAFSARMPVICSGHGGLAEIVRDGINGFTFTPGNPQSLADIINRCIDNPGLLARCAHTIPPVKDMKTHAQELVELYKEIMTSR